MRKFLLVILISFMASSAALAAPAVFFKDNSNGSRTLYAHKPSAAKTTNFKQAAENNKPMDLQIMIPLSPDNQQKLKDLLKGLYDPKSAAFHKFLTPAQFNQQFRPSDSDINTVKAYFKTKGFAIGDLSPNGSLLNIRGTVQTVNNTFGVNINYYKKNDGTMFYAPNTDPMISSDLVGKVTAIGGLDNLTRFKPNSHIIPLPKTTPATQTKTIMGGLQTKSILSGAQIKTPKSIGTGPGGFLAPSDVKKAYALDTIPTINDPSSLQNIALFELDGYKLSDICAYETFYSPLPTNECNPNTTIIQNVSIDSYDGTPIDANGAGEVTIDIEQLIGIASSSIKKILVYEALNSLQGWEDEWNQIANDNTSKIISCSWGDSELSSPTTAFDSSIFAQMAAQGQEVFVASGDNGANTDNSSTNLSVSEPADQPFATSVGISKAILNSDESYASEIGSQFSGGGVSTIFEIPSYQKAMAQSSVATGVSQTMRNLPDVSLTADPATSYAFYFTNFSTGTPVPGFYGFWGSSIGAPTWAAFLLQAYQARAHAGKSNLGFINPVLYQIAGTGNYSQDFHDITTGSNFLTMIDVNSNLVTTTSPTYPSGAVYPAGTGLDNVTGLGSFNGLNLLNDLLSQDISTPSAPTGLGATAGNASIALSWTASSGATSYNVKRSTSDGGPYTTSVATSVSGTTFTDNSTNDPGNTPVNGTTYYYVVTAVNVGGESANSTQASATPVPPAPSAPTGLGAIAGDASVSLSWTAGANASSYKVYRSTDDSTFTFINNAGSSTSYTDNSLTNGTKYYYVVTSYNVSGESAYSNHAFATPTALPPSAPTVSTPTVGDNSVSLSWTASSGATSYNVKRSTTNGSGYVIVASLISGTTFTDNSTNDPGNTPVNGTTYYYVVTAVNAGGESGISNQVIATPVPPAPSAPTGLGATAGNASIALSWTASSGATSYNVKRSTSSGGPYSTSVATAVSGTTFTDNSTNDPGNTPINGTTYYYVVTAVNAGGESANSTQASATPVPPAPSAPSGLGATAGDHSVALSWTAGANASSYKIYRSIDDSSFTFLNSAGSSTSYTDNSSVNGTTYYYVVTSFNISGESAYSNHASATPTALPVPNAPTGLGATAGDSLVSLSWTASSGATSYNVKRSTSNGGPYSTSVATSVSGTTFTDNSTNDLSNTPVNGTTYYYVVTAVNTSGESSNSNQASATPIPPVPSAPTGLGAIAGDSSVALSWTASSGATSYNVKRSTSDGGPYTTNVATAVSGTTFIDNSTNDPSNTPVNGTTYYYVVTAVNVGGESANSTQASATPVPPALNAPTNFTASLASWILGSQVIQLKWNQSTSPNITQNKVYYTEGTATTYTALPILSARNSVQYLQCKKNTVYHFKITAINSNGTESPASNITTVTTTKSAITITTNQVWR